MPPFTLFDDVDGGRWAAKIAIEIVSDKSLSILVITSVSAFPTVATRKKNRSFSQIKSRAAIEMFSATNTTTTTAYRLQFTSIAYFSATMKIWALKLLAVSTIWTANRVQRIATK